MINLYLGNTGSGKSLHVTRDIRFALKNGQLVIANYAIFTDMFAMHDESKFVYIKQKDLTYPYRIVKEVFEYKKEYPDNRVLIILDEAQMLFDNRKWKDPGRDEWVLFFTHHRKIMGDKGEVILLTQRETSLDPKVYDIVEYKSYHRKLCNYGFIGFLLGMVTGDRMHHYVTYWAPCKEIVNSSFFLRKKKDCEIYDTYDMFDLFDDIDFNAWIEKSE